MRKQLLKTKLTKHYEDLEKNMMGQHHKIRLQIALFLLFLCLTACEIPVRPSGRQARMIALSHGWQPVSLKSGGFVLKGFVKDSEVRHDCLIVYIEGDGLAWKNRHTLSDDPTPRDPLALRLAIQDTGSKVLYLGRPGQYPEPGDVECDARYWSTHRYSPKVVHAMSRAIDQIKQKTQVCRLGLLGVSGGGTVAALLAAKREDVAWFATVAANLDHEAWTSLHHVTRMRGSLNPADFALRLQSVPQIHFVGGKDSNVPESVIRAYTARMTDPSRTQIAVIPQNGHHCCWAEMWPVLQAQIPNRNGKEVVTQKENHGRGQALVPALREEVGHGGLSLRKH